MNLLLAISNSTAASILLKATLILALNLILSALMRRARASLRHTLLTATFAILLALPIASYFAPPIRITTTFPTPAPQRQIRFFDVPVASKTPTALFTTATAPTRPRMSATEWLLIAWLTGTILFLLPMSVGFYQVRSLRRSAAPWTRCDCAQILIHPEICGPMTCGIFRPAILFPRDAESWAAGDLNRALVHELEHVRRADWLTQCIARAVCSVYWFHPLAWIAWRRLVLEAELSCDDAVLAGSDATAYADQLIHLAQYVSGRTPMLAMANRADLSRRVRSLLDSRQPRGRAGAFWIALTSVIALAIVFSFSPLRLVAAPQAPQPAPVIAQAQTPPPPPPPPVTPRPAPALAPPAAQKQPVSPAPPVPPAPQQGQQLQFSSTTEMVIVTVIVSDSNGKSVADLNASDFSVLEDGMAKTLAVFEFTKNSDPPYYLVGYYVNSQPDGKFRYIEVKVDLPGVTLKARDGYYNYGPGTLPPPPPIPRDVVNAILPNDVTPPVPTYAPQAEYSDAARRGKWSGLVALQVTITPSGAVSNIVVVRSLGLGLDQKAIEALAKWKFKPATRDGMPVPVAAQIDMAFHLL